MTGMGLDRLSETERRIAQQLAEAKQDADAIVEAARRAAAEEEERFAAELEAAAGVVEAGVRAEHEIEAAAIRERVDRELARLRDLPDPAISAIAARLLDQALAARPEDAT